MTESFALLTAASILRSCPRFGAPPYLNANYWSFLRSLLEEATGCGAVDSPSLVEPFSVAAFTSLKTPVVPLFTGFASRLARELETSAPNDGAPTCLLDGGHVLATLLELSSDCLRMLANSDAGSAVLSSSLDYQAALIPPLVDVLFRLWDTKTGMDRAWRTRAQRAALCTLSLALMLFESQLAGQGNQKKVFTLVTGKLLAPLLRLRCSACGKQEECFECLCSVNAILRTSLFHISTIADYFSVLPICPAKRDGVKQPSAKGPKSLENDGGGNLIQSYQRALFHELAKLAQNRDEDNSFGACVPSVDLSRII
ncbi:MAG: hypothetical protein BJ554DRAFT_7730 [Olpidium bornovanus]|uniref:Uncharacterized protein n=1 Tax=Olpidium bornovanus TaxID=278681 RepID=A0A8H7ZV72_9FUNG|nr:MAG: hypothetical protein BJ554DRAFT_7730 [Olpidium bornovanus]